MTKEESVVLCSELRNEKMTRRDVTEKDDGDSCNSCRMCGAELTGKQKTCSVKCRVVARIADRLVEITKRTKRQFSIEQILQAAAKAFEAFTEYAMKVGGPPLKTRRNNYKREQAAELAKMKVHAKYEM